MADDDKSIRRWSHGIPIQIAVIVAIFSLTWLLRELYVSRNPGSLPDRNGFYIALAAVVAGAIAGRFVAWRNERMARRQVDVSNSEPSRVSRLDQR